MSDNLRELLGQTVLDHFHGPDQTHSSWWINTDELADALLPIIAAERVDAAAEERRAVDDYAVSIFEGLAAEFDRLRSQVQAVEALCDRAKVHDHDGFPMTYTAWVRKALDVGSEAPA